MSRPFPAILGALAALLVYAVTLGGTYVYDDTYIVQRDERLPDVRRWGEFWTKDYFNGGADNLYRPLVSMTYAAQFKLHGAGDRAAWAYHLVNWLLHAGVAAAVAELARRMSRGNITIALLAGLLFVVHPIHVEAVANIVGRAELMCGLGIALALVLFLRPLTIARAFGIWGCFVFALLSKEQGMFVPLLLLAAVPLHRRDFRTATLAPQDVVDRTDPPALETSEAPRVSQAVTVLILLLLWTLAGYILFRERILKFWWDRSFLDPTINPMVRSHGLDRALMPFSLLGRYVALLIAPVRQSLDYGGAIIGSQVRASDPYLYLGLFAGLAWIAGFAVACLRRAWAVALCLFALAVLVGLVSNALSLIGTIFAERLMYSPSIFACILMAMLLARLPRRAMMATATLVIVLYSARTIVYAWQWNDRLRLYNATATAWPDSGRLELLRGEELGQRGRYDDALASLARARELEPKYYRVYLTSAAVARDAGRLDLAEQFALEAHRLNPTLGGLAMLNDIQARKAATTSRPATTATAPTTAPR
jgi:hypothetical protein